MSGRRTGSLIGLIALMTVAALGFTGCTTVRVHRTASPVRSSVVVRPQPVPPTPTGVPTYSQYPVPASVPNNPAKRAQVKINGCTSTGSAAVATGTVHNDGSRSSSYNITVFFTSPSATAVNYATTTLTVASKASATFTARRVFAAPTSVLCVLVGVS